MQHVRSRIPLPRPGGALLLAALLLSTVLSSPALAQADFHIGIMIDDLGVVDYLKVYTFLSREEISELEAQQQAHPEARPAQRRLAEEVTKLVRSSKSLFIIL